MKLPRQYSEKGPLLQYLEKLQASQPDLAAAVRKAVRAMTRSDEGKIFLDLMDEAIINTQLPIMEDARAYAARNAQGLIAADLRRIASDEHEELVRQQDHAGGARRGPARRRGSAAG